MKYFLMLMVLAIMPAQDVLARNTSFWHAAKVSLDLFNTDYATANSVVEYEISNTDLNLSSIDLQFDPVAITIQRVVLGGNEVPFSINKEKITINLPTGQDLRKLAIFYEFKIKTTKQFEHVDNWQFKNNELYFFNEFLMPRPDDKVYPEISHLPFTIQFKIKSNQDVYMQGSKILDQTRADQRLIEYQTVDLVTSLYSGSIFIGQLAEKDLSINGKIYKYFYHSTTNQKCNQIVEDNLAKAIDYYESLYATKLPYAEVKIIHIGDGQIANTMSNTVFLSNAILTDYFSEVEVFVHELAHLWFGGITHSSHLWMNEGFASFSALEYLSSLSQTFSDRRLMKYKKEIEFFVARDCFIYGNTSCSILKPGGSADPFYSDYLQPIFVLKNLKYVLGDQVFADFFSKYLSEYFSKSITENDFINFSNSYLASQPNTIQLLKEMLNMNAITHFKLEKLQMASEFAIKFTTVYTSPYLFQFRLPAYYYDFDLEIDIIKSTGQKTRIVQKFGHFVSTYGMKFKNDPKIVDIVFDPDHKWMVGFDFQY